MPNSTNEWELSKENIQPLQQGRKPGVLRAALATHPEDKLLYRRRLFEQELRTYAGDDPLNVWCEYIKWVEQNYPKGGREGSVGKLIQQCLSVLKDEEKYANDQRFVDIWFKFANMSIKPLDIYSSMYSHNIACKKARFYIAWAWEVEQSGNIRRADEILTEGLRRNAEPVEILKSAQQQFEARLSKSFSTDSGKKTAMFDTEAEHRSAFTLLKPQKKNKAPIERIGDSTLQTSQEKRSLPQTRKPAQSKLPFKIYSGENQPSILPTQNERTSDLVLDSHGLKENEKKLSKWTKVRVHQSSAAHAATALGFDFHCDEIPQPGSARKLSEGDSVLSSKKHPVSPPIALFEPPDHMKRPMYNKMKVYGGAEEFSFEEIRAAAWFKKQRKQVKELERLKEKEEVLVVRAEMKRLQESLEDLRSQISVKRTGSEVQPCVNSSGGANHSAGLHRTPNKGQVFTSASDMLSGHKTKDGAVEEVDNRMREQPHCAQKLLGSEQPCTLENKNEQKPYSINLNLEKSHNGLPPAAISDTMISNIVQELYNGTLSYNSKDGSDLSLGMPLGKSQSNENIFDDISKFHTSLHTATAFLKGDDLHQDAPDVDHAVGRLPQEHSVKKNQSAFTFYDSAASVPSKQDAMPFLIYEDNKNSECSELRLPTIDAAGLAENDVFDEAKDDAENIPPPWHIESTEKRELAGVLQPSKDIYFVPLEEQESEEEDDECLAEPLPPFDNMTIIPLLNGEQFSAAAGPFSSTPCVKSTAVIGKRECDDDKSGKNDPDFTSELMPPPCSVTESSPLVDLLRNAILLENSSNVQEVLRCALDSLYGKGERDVKKYREVCENLQVCLELSTCPKLHSLLKQAIALIEINTGKGRDFSQSNQCSAYPFSQLSTIMETSREGSCKSSSSSSSRSMHPTLSHHSSSLLCSTTKVYPAEPVIDASAKLPVTSAGPNDHLVSQGKMSHGNVTLADNQCCADIDPFDPSTTTRLLQSLQLPLQERENFFVNHGSVGCVKVGSELSAGSIRYIIENVHAKGAYANIYSAHKYEPLIFDSNQSILPLASFALKVCKKANRWEFYVCSELNDRLRKNDIPPDVTNSVMEIKSAVEFRNGIVLISDFYELGTLLDVANAYKKQRMRVPECLVMYFALEMLQILTKVHQCNIVHGDVKPDNFVLNEVPDDSRLDTLLEKTSCLRLLDFGRAIDLSLFRAGITFKQAVLTKDFQCGEMKEGRPWVFQSDWFGVLGCIHVLLFSEYMCVQKNTEGIWEPKSKYKRWPSYDIWQPMFHALLNMPSPYDVPDLQPCIDSLAKCLEKQRNNFKFSMKQMFVYLKK